MTPDQLRQALGICEKAAAPEGVYRREYDQILDAARRWLRLQEGDQQLVERVHAELSEWWSDDKDPFHFLELARAVLAAITEEEEK